jgi:hypothetical protein
MNIKELVELMDLVEIKKETIIRYREVKLLCSYSYKGHKKGCPNVENCKNIPFFDKIREINKKYFYLLIANFDYEKYQEIRSLEKPEWSRNKIRCVLYWQNSVKKMLKENIEFIFENNFLENDYLYILGCGSRFKLSFQKEVFSMESTGINVFSTLKLNHIEYDLKAINNVKLVCLLCSNQKIERY